MKMNPWARRQSRRTLVQAMYQWQVGGADQTAVLREYLGGDSLKKADKPFFEDVFKGTASRVDRQAGVAAELEEALDPEIAPHLDRQLKDLDQVERALLRLGAYELKHRLDVPYRVVVSEYVELAKTFGAEESHKYINAILDRLAKTFRAVEVAAQSASSDRSA